MLHSKAVAALRANRDYATQYTPIQGVPRGTSINVPVPFKFTLRTGAAMAAQNMVQRYVPLLLNQQNGCDVNLTSIERQFDIAEFEEKVIAPATAIVAAGINANVTALVPQIPAWVGTSSTSVTYANVLTARRYLTEALAPEGVARSLLASPQHNQEFVLDNKALFNPEVAIADQWMEGIIASKVAGFMAFEEPKITTYTTGTFGASTPVTKTGLTQGNAGTGNAYVSTMTLSTTGWDSGASTLNAGDSFTISGVYAVDYETKQSLGRLQQFVVTAKISDSTGEIDAVVAPAAIYGGAYQNVSNAVAASSTITLMAASNSTVKLSLAMHRDAILFASVPLADLSQVVKWSANESYDGFSIRVIQTYDTDNDLVPLRLDTLSGETLGLPELGVKIIGLPA